MKLSQAFSTLREQNKTKKPCQVCVQGLHVIGQPTWIWPVFVKCVLNKQVSLLAEVEDMECGVWQELCHSGS